MIFDTHAHYEDNQFDEDREELLASMKSAGIVAVTNVGSSMKTSNQCVQLAKKYDFIYAAVGVHPDHVPELTQADMEELKAMASCSKVRAIGEIGLDYYYEDPERTVQQKWFATQMDLAWELGLPVIVHSRDAAKDTYDILRAHHGQETGGVIHCFSYSVEMAKQFIELGFFIGIGGALTFKNARKAREVVTAIPLDKIVIETDCPYMAPVPNRGKRNSSLYLPYVVEEIARLKGITTEEVLTVTENNAKRLYGL